MRYWVGVTDNAWFDFLCREQPDEVNFWQPSGRAPFVRLEPGALFLFKLKSPFNHIAGGGYLVKFSALPLSMAWDAFGTKNGAATFEKFAAMIRRLQRSDAAFDPVVGCTVLAQPFFFPREEWIDLREVWPSNVVTGRYYDSDTEAGRAIWNAVHHRDSSASVVAEPAERYGTPTLVRPRLGQGAFQVLVMDAYRRRCAITGESTLPVLEAAHILPFSEAGPHEVGNGMLLRSDFHKLFDRGLITVTPSLDVEVSSIIHEQWFNGRVYYDLHGRRLANIPEIAADRPDPQFLAWHNEHRFQRG
jgi:putative restriction endonuclease